MAKRRKYIAKNIRKKRIYLSLLLACVLMIGLGYSIIATNLSIGGTLGISKYDQTLYGVLEKAYKKGFARKYTGEHQDSFTGNGTKDIYHWYAANDTDGTAIQDKNNVIFAGHCWQMIRSTDTGGVKLIYNGEAENNQCLNTRGTHVGYGGNRTTQNLASNYYYGTDYNYDSINNVFSLSGTLTQATWNASTGPTLVGKYTCKQTTESGTCATLYLVESYYTANSGYVIPLKSNSHYSQFGTLQYNANYNSPSYVGYMYNVVYPYQIKSPNTESMLSSYSLSTSYWYAHNVVWGSPTANQYNLSSPYQVSATTDYPNLVGEYTFRRSTQTYTNSNVYYIAAVNGSNMYYIYLDNTGNHTLADFNHAYTYGDSYTDNGNGTYTINNPTTIHRSDWYTGYSNVNNKYVCKNATNNTCSELWYTTSTSIDSILYIKFADVYKYSKSFTWDGSKYVLDNNTSVSFWNYTDSINQTSLNNAHYTCWNETGECTSISYIYYLGATIYYINLTNGESIEDAKNKMLYANDVNTLNSTIKTGIDAWYAKYLSSYDTYIEDTIFCNDRSISSLAGWNPNGGKITEYLHFKGYNVTSDLSCTNETNQFSTLNPKAQLTYKVGLMSSPEMKLLNNDKARVTGKSYWLASPNYFNNRYAVVRAVGSASFMDSYLVYNSDGVRPAISLRPGIEYVSGSGTMADPYIVDTLQMNAEGDRLGNITTTFSEIPFNASGVEYSLDGENWQSSNQFVVSNSGNYTVYGKINYSDGTSKVLSDVITIEIRYKVEYRLGLELKHIEYIDKGSSIQYCSNNYCSNNYNSGENYQYFGIYSDSMLTNEVSYSYVPTHDMTIYMLVSHFFGDGFHNEVLETHSTLQDLNLEFVSALVDGVSSNMISVDGSGNVVLNGYPSSDAIEVITYRNITTQELINVKYFYGACLLKNTEILIEEEYEDENKKKRKRRRLKKIQDITYDDDLVVWDFDNGCESTAKPLWIAEDGTEEDYIHIEFDDDSFLDVVTAHRIFNVDLNKFTYANDDLLTPVGTRVYKEDGSIVRIVSKKRIYKTIKFYNIMTYYHMNMFANGLLTSCRFNNLYEIENMKFIKDNRKLRNREEFSDLDDEFIDGLRLLEQPDDDIDKLNAVHHADNLNEYIKWLKNNMKPKK